MMNIQVTVLITSWESSSYYILHRFTATASHKQPDMKLQNIYYLEEKIKKKKKALLF